MAGVEVKSDQQVNIYSFVVRCDRRWPRTQWHRVYTSSGNVPYVQFESVGDFIPKPRCSKFVVGLQTRRRKMGYRRGPVGSGRKGQERQELRYELSVQECAWSPNPAVLWSWASELNWCLLSSRRALLFVGGGASPFIDKGDGFTSERVRVRMLPSLVAHTGRFKIMVGTYNTIDVTIECQMYMGGRAAFFRDSGRRYLQILFDA